MIIIIHFSIKTSANVTFENNRNDLGDYLEKTFQYEIG